MIKKLLLLCVVVVITTNTDVLAQQTDIFAAPKFRKIEKTDMPAFLRKYNINNLTGRGLQANQTIDDLPTMELRARLQGAYGNPTKNVIDLMGEPGFRPAMNIQFEYWFEIDDSIPLVILDTSGPFSTGLTYGGLARFVDMMPEIKREFNKILMDAPLAEYSDYYNALDERDKTKGVPIPDGWYLVQYKNGIFSYEKTTAPRRN